ncbi:MAG: hypothetical protein AAGJ18_12045 [Bacteroidota bacterium]
MTTFKLNLAAIIIAIFALTSCQKETMSELHPTTEATTQRLIPAEGIHTVNEAAQTLSTDRTRQQFATSRENTVIRISPNAGPIFDDTRGEGNTIHSRNAPCLNVEGDNFNGPDNIYLFKAEEQADAVMTYHITISDMTDDLDLFVYTLDERGYVRECKAKSMTIGNTDETIAVSGLNAGYYIIVVDGWMEQAVSSYNLDFYTTAVSANPPSINAVDVLTKFNFGTVYEDGSFQDLGFYEVTGAILGDNDEDIITFREHSTENDLPHFGENTENDFYFIKVGSDEWSVYLRDDSRGINIQLDMNRKKVVYSDDAGNAFDLYDITYAY